MGELGLREKGENWRGAENKTQKAHVNGSVWPLGKLVRDAEPHRAQAPRRDEPQL